MEFGLKSSVSWFYLRSGKQNSPAKQELSYEIVTHKVMGLGFFPVDWLFLALCPYCID